MTVVPLRPLAQAQADAMNYGVGFSLGEKRIDPHDVYLQAEAPKLLAPGTLHTVDGFVPLGTIAETIAEQLQARRKRAQQDEVERLYRELTESNVSNGAETWPLATWPFPAPVPWGFRSASDILRDERLKEKVPAALPSTPSAEPERPHIPIDEMTLDDCRRGVARTWVSYHGP